MPTLTETAAQMRAAANALEGGVLVDAQTARVVTMALLHELDSLHRDHYNPRNSLRHLTRDAATRSLAALRAFNASAAEGWESFHGRPSRWYYGNGAIEQCACHLTAARKQEREAAYYGPRAARQQLHRQATADY